MVSSTSKMQPVYELGGRFAVGEKFYVRMLGFGSTVSHGTTDPGERC
jgi:hypothetical protein